MIRKSQKYFCLSKDGNIVYSQTGDTATWNTMSSKPGVYTMIAMVKDIEAVNNS